MPRKSANAESPSTSRQKPPPSNVGAMIRELRTAKDMTIAELARRIKRSVGYISQVERDQSGVSIVTLQQIADALSVGINWFFAGQSVAPVAERDILVRKGNRRILNLEDTGVLQELLSPTLSGELELIMTTFQPSKSTGRGGRMRKGEEAGLLLSGHLDLCVDGKRFKMEPGDSYSLRHRGRHRFENHGKTPAVLLCVVTPPNAY